MHRAHSFRDVAGQVLDKIQHERESEAHTIFRSHAGEWARHGTEVAFTMKTCTMQKHKRNKWEVRQVECGMSRPPAGCVQGHVQLNGA